MELGEQREVAGTWLQQGEANPILLILGEDGSLTYYPTVTEENIYHSSFQVENDTLRLEMVNLDGSGVTSVPFAMEADPADERRMSIAVDRELAARGLKSRIVLQIHDELLVEAETGELSRVKEILAEEMQGAAELSVPLEIDMKQGMNWYEAH